jgi:hypothetical protein
MIQVNPSPGLPRKWHVTLDGRAVGVIKETKQGTGKGYTYHPRGSRLTGLTFPSLAECVASLKG